MKIFELEKDDVDHISFEELVELLLNAPFHEVYQEKEFKDERDKKDKLV